jgi:hypothetical protein
MQECLRTAIDVDLKGLSRIISHIVMEAGRHLIAEPERFALGAVGM